MKFIGRYFLQMYHSAALSTASQTELSKKCNSLHLSVSDNKKETKKISNIMNASVE